MINLIPVYLVMQLASGGSAFSVMTDAECKQALSEMTQLALAGAELQLEDGARITAATCYTPPIETCEVPNV